MSKTYWALLYFYMWQFGIVNFIKRKKLAFDIAHNLNFHSDWTPTFLWRLGKPTFWGPIGHHPPVPKNFLKKHYDKSHYIKDRVYAGVKWVLRNCDPFFRIAVRKTTKI